MLNGGGGLNPDGLSLDLQFAADKTLTARKGPRPDFTRASTNGTFMGSNGLIQTAAINTPRFDHTSAGVCRGLLIEESRTNICRQSENFGSFWSAGGCAVSIDTDVAPDGNTTADSVNITNGGGHFVQQTISVSASTVYTFSFWVKRGTATALSYSIFNSTAGSNIVAPTSYYNQTSSAWARVSFTFTTPVGCASIAVYPLRDGGSTGTVLLWGAQVEAGSFATSYIPTGAGSAVRSADVCSITGANFTSFWNTNEGAMLASGDPRAGAAVSIFVMANSGANANQIAFDRSTTALKFGIANSGTYTATISQNSTNGSFVKISGAYATNNARSAVNGVLGTPDTSVIVPTNLNRFNIGSSSTASTEFANGCIAEIKYFRKPLSNAKLQALTV